MRIGIIGGTGVYELVGDVAGHTDRVTTPYGPVELTAGKVAGRDLVFLTRHGQDHSIPPHKINYLANIDALRRRQCDCIIATNAVGSIRLSMQPGDFVLPDQFIDFTRCRPSSFYDGGAAGVRHVDVTEPYCPALCNCALHVLRESQLTIHPAATYVCTEGPRFETPAEIRMFEHLGGDLVGMTGLPEVVLAREAGICYMSLCVVTNFAAGVKGEPLTEGEVGDLMRSRLPQLRDLLLRLVAELPDGRECACRGGE
jgi:5'-methylthioadenosine phosphorylase